MSFSSIDKPSKYFNTILHTGNNTNPFSFTGVGFQPDFIWGKGRNNTFSHALFDSVRGVNKYLSSNGTGAEITNPTSGYLSSFNSDGFTAVAGTSNFANFNDNTINTPSTYVFWNWLANGTGVSNTSGTITSTVSANTTSGFSIVSYTGTGSLATVGHGLGVAPKFIIIKNRTATGNAWRCYQANLFASNSASFIDLSSTSGVDSGNSVFNSTAPTSSVFTVNTNTEVNQSGQSIIAYCFAEIKGFSKFGSYTGNGNADGTFVYTGFSPAFLIIKQSSASGENWYMWDNKRSTYNVGDNRLYPNLSNSEETGTILFDWLSNGFKLRSTYVGSNSSGATYIYMAFASNPFVSSKGLPTTAR
jgi:hypothetical protein